MAYKKSENLVSKIVAGVLALAVAAGGVCCLGYASRNDEGKWFGGLHWSDNGLNEGNGNGGSIITNDGESNGMLLSATAIPLASYEEYGISALAENAFALSVTYTPSDTTYQATTFTAKFADGTDCSAFATVTSTGDTTATLTILQAFSKQIIVTATCDRNTAIKATTTVDYVGTFNLDLLSFSSWDMDGDCQCVSINQSTPFVNGTLCPDGSEKAFTVIYDTAWIAQRVASAGFNFTVADSVTYEYSCTSDEYGVDLHDPGIAQILKKACNKESLIYGSAEYKTWWSNISSAILNGKTPEEMNEDSYTIFDNIKVITHRVYNGVDYGDVTLFDGECVANGWEIFEVSATSLAYSSSAIIAG